jgi:predicted membrane protein
MVLILGNYIGLFIAVILPTLALRVFDLSDSATNVLIALSVVLTVVVALLVRLISAPANSEVVRHLNIQKDLLLIFVVGGLLGALGIFALYGPSKSALDVVASILWLVSVAMIVWGIYRSCRELTRRP